MSASDPIFANLNKPQKQAVEHTTGPLLILAGAGSGKTRALTHRIAHLIHQGVPPWQILAVTFTNKAAKEMKSRIENMLHITEGEDYANWGSHSAKLPVMGTFHSICARVLRRDIDKLGRDRSFVIYDQDDQEKLVKNILKEIHIEESELKARAVLGYIGRFKCEALTPVEAQKQVTTPRMEQVVRAFAAYEKGLRACNALDFDDLILEAVRLFHEVPEVLDRYQETWRFLNVDEYQDTNHSQYLFVTLLARKYRNLCVIGDPDQSIYAFRGADIRNILEFQKEYRDALEIKLEQNYRSTQMILSAADAVIAANPRRPEKTMWSERKEGPKVTVNEMRDEKLEAEEAVKQAEAKKKEGIPLNDQVVLYRTNAQSRLFEEACMRLGLPYRIVGGVKFYMRREVKDVLAYLHVLLNPHDTISLLRILNVPARKIGETTLEKIQVWNATAGLPLWDALCSADKIEGIAEATKGRIASFVELIRELQKAAQTLTVSDLTTRLLRTVDLEKWLRDDTEEGEERWQNVQELLSVMYKYDGLTPENSLVSFLEEVALVSEVDKLSDTKDDALTLMTLHLCKGLEFEHVMIGGCEEGIFPHASSLFDPAQLEEERRLMYVGMTRAKTHLTLFFTRSRMLWGETRSNAPSRFLDDLPDAVTERRSDSVLSAFAWASESGEQKAAKGGKLEPYRQEEHLNVEFNQDTGLEDGTQETMTEGTRVEHPTFGQGEVTAVRGGVVEIQFDSGQKKIFAISIAPLKIL
ncbi:MAG: UvrD-helicase domain-containing protein [Candidatus Peribacteraceae bacterium]|nr:UvrD-helicase domain-containing protein [Candidatus Peribacteraceae bacterium]MDD5075410.1 UvrD-helicase domain-containing protein [Candidatus Peribacteraceae bacterium]